MTDNDDDNLHATVTSDQIASELSLDLNREVFDDTMIVGPDIGGTSFSIEYDNGQVFYVTVTEDKTSRIGNRLARQASYTATQPDGWSQADADKAKGNA